VYPQHFTVVWWVSLFFAYATTHTYTLLMMIFFFAGDKSFFIALKDENCHQTLSAYEEKEIDKLFFYCLWAA
jgi:hypothetical protein